MSELDFLASLLGSASKDAVKPMTASSGIDQLLRVMEQRSKARPNGLPPDDHQLAAVRQFWNSQEIRSFRDACLLSSGLVIPHQPDGPCILEDRTRLQRVLDGVDVLQDRPSRYRRCYQGLVRSYFSYDALDDSTAPSARNNWRLLREYLHERNPRIRAGALNPTWVDSALNNRGVFGDKPCEPYVAALLRGDTSAIDQLCEHLGISKASWFLRELVMAQVEGATRLGDRQFKELLPVLLKMLAANQVLRDRGMVKVLDRYNQVESAQMHLQMRDHAVAWWGNPWLPSNATRWGGVKPETRAMVADWLKLEFIEAFFTMLAEDGLADPRRMNFWKKYVKAIQHIEFALGSAARNSTDRDFVSLRKKMHGLTRELDANGTKNAFIMHMGPLVAVEFSEMGNAFYGYDSSAIPFDSRKTLGLIVNGPNTLKNKDRQILWLGHGAKDGYATWEDYFEAVLRKDFGIQPHKELSASARARGSLSLPTFESPPAPAGETRGMASSRPAPAPDAVTPVAPRVRQDPRPEPPAVGAPDPSTLPYSRAALEAFAKQQRLEIRDLSNVGGNLWVVISEKNLKVDAALMRWGFRNKPGKGWWK